MTISSQPATAPTPTTRAGITAGLLFILALLAAVAPFATDLYLPAFPTMAAELGTDATGVQLTLTSFLIGVALGQLVFGPLSDRVGRRVPLILGALVFVASSIATVFAPTLEVLIAARFLQGLSGAAGMVLGRAVISDLETGPAVAKAMSLMMIVGGVAPVVAPLLGGALTAPLGWRGLLAVVLGIAVVMLIAVVFGVRESLPRARREELALLKRSVGSPLRALVSREYIGYTLTFAFSFTVMMAYISASPFLYQSLMGVDELQYGLLFGLNALALMASSAVSAKLVERIAPRTLIAVGLGGVAVGAVGFLLLVLFAAPAWTLGVAVFIVVASLGAVFGNATALALGAVPGAAGSASAVLGALQFGLAAVVSPLVSIGGETSALPLGIVMVVAIAVASVAYRLARR